MTVLYQCDRCGDTDQLHTREVTIEMVCDHPTMSQSGVPRTLHLCGYCTSLLRETIDGESPMRVLQQWKDEAMPLLQVMEQCHDLLPQEYQAVFGTSKAEAVKQYLAGQHAERR